ETMIQRIIFTKLKAGQLDHSALALEDMRILVERMSDTLVNMHHHRIKYQWQAKQAEEFGVPSQVARASAPDIQLKESVLPASMPPASSSPTKPASDLALENAEERSRIVGRRPS